MPAKRQHHVDTQSPRPRGRPKSDDVPALEARLILVARRSFIAHGYGATSMTAVARAARVSKDTLYARFPGKADLFRAIVSEQIAHMEDELRRADLEHHRTLKEKLWVYGKQIIKTSLSGELLQVNRLIYSECARFPELAEAAVARVRVGIHLVASYIREFAVKDGYPCRDPLGAAEVYVMMIRGWYNQVALTDRLPADAEQTAWVDKIVRLFMASRSEW